MSSLREQATAHVEESASATSMAKVVAKPSRIDYVDVSRGLLVLLMFVVHAATPCAPSIRDSIQRLWIFEIATTGFAMMAGYTVGIRYDVDRSLPQPRRLWKRCGELLIVMFWSNCLLGVAKLYVTQQPDAAMLASWFLGLFTFQTEYNISGVLLPIALLLPLLPLIYATENLIGRVGGLLWFTAIVALIALLNHFTIENAALEHVRNILLAGLGGFSLLAFLAYGLLGYVNARVFQLCQKMGWSFGVVVSAGLVISSIVFAMVGSIAAEEMSGSLPRQWGLALLPFIRSEVMFLGVIALGGLFAGWWSEFRVIEPLRLLGTYALCAFVFHRFVGQGLMTALHLQGGELGTFLLMLTVISSSTYLLLVARQSIGALDAGLKRLYL